MLPDRVLNPGPLTYESGALPIALRGPATTLSFFFCYKMEFFSLQNNPKNLDLPCKMDLLYLFGYKMGFSIL